MSGRPGSLSRSGADGGLSFVLSVAVIFSSCGLFKLSKLPFFAAYLAVLLNALEEFDDCLFILSVPEEV